MTICAVVLCDGSSDNKTVDPTKEKIILDDYGTVLDGEDIRFNGLPAMPKTRGKMEPSKDEIGRMKNVRAKWFISIGREVC